MDGPCETIDDFLARGGKVTVVPTVLPPTGRQTMKPTNRQPPQLLTLAEGAYFFGETNKRKKRKKKKIDARKTINLSLIPKKLLKKLGF